MSAVKENFPPSVAGCTKREKLGAEEVSHRMWCVYEQKNERKNKWLQLCVWSVYLLEDGRKNWAIYRGELFFFHKI